MGRLLSRLGIGAATVETILPDGAVTPGETIDVTVEIEGGSVQQTTDGLYFGLLTRTDGREQLIAQFRVAESLAIDAGQSRTIETAITIPPWTPVTRHDRRVWLKTGLDVTWSVDPNDEDDIAVAPGSHMEALFAAAEDLGFEPRGSEVRQPDWHDWPLVQAFRYEPGPTVYRDDVEALTLVPLSRERGLRTVIEIDEAEPAEAETDVAYDQQEILHVFETADRDRVRRQLRSRIDQNTHVE